MNYNHKYLKYKNKYLMLSNKLNGGAITNAPLDNNIKIVRPNGEVIHTLTNVPRNADGTYNRTDLEIACSTIMNPTSFPFKIVTSSGIEIYFSLFNLSSHLDNNIEIEFNTLTLVSLAYTPSMLNVFDPYFYFGDTRMKSINAKLLYNVFNENPDLIWDKNYLLYLISNHHEGSLSSSNLKGMLEFRLRINLPQQLRSIEGININPDVELQNNKNFWRFILQFERDYLGKKWDIYTRNSVFHVAFELASEALQNDNDFIKELLKISPWMISYGLNNLDDESLIPYILDNPFILQRFTISDRLAYKIASEADIDQTKNLVDKCGLWLKYLPENMKKDKNIVESAFNDNPTYLEFIDSSLKSDKNFLKDIFIKAINNSKLFNLGEAISFADDIIQNDPSFFLEIYSGLTFDSNQPSKQRYKIVQFLSLIQKKPAYKNPELEKLINELREKEKL
jgi:hypothetical protein